MVLFNFATQHHQLLYELHDLCVQHSVYIDHLHGHALHCHATPRPAPRSVYLCHCLHLYAGLIPPQIGIKLSISRFFTFLVFTFFQVYLLEASSALPQIWLILHRLHFIIVQLRKSLTLKLILTTARNF